MNAWLARYRVRCRWNFVKVVVPWAWLDARCASQAWRRAYLWAEGFRRGTTATRRPPRWVRWWE
jgi:hypothetical protein